MQVSVPILLTAQCSVLLLSPVALPVCSHWLLPLFRVASKGLLGLVW